MSRHDTRGGLGKYGVVAPTVVRQPARNPDGTHICPECGHDITDSKETHPVVSPDFASRDLVRDFDGELYVFGWRCTRHAYDVVTPVRCDGADASNLSSGWIGVRLAFADQRIRWVATPRREFDSRDLDPETYR